MNMLTIVISSTLKLGSAFCIWSSYIYIYEHIYSYINPYIYIYIHVYTHIQINICYIYDIYIRTMVISSTLKLGSAFCIWSSNAVARSHRIPPVQYMRTFLPLILNKLTKRTRILTYICIYLSIDVDISIFMYRVNPKVEKNI